MRDSGDMKGRGRTRKCGAECDVEATESRDDILFWIEYPASKEPL